MEAVSCGAAPSEFTQACRKDTFLVLALAFLEAVPALAVPQRPSILDATVAPSDGRAGLPTNARIFTDYQSGFVVSVAGLEAVVVTQAEGQAATGYSLGELLPSSSYEVTLDDGIESRTISLQTGASADLTPPAAPGSVAIRAVRTPLSGPGEGGLELFDINVTLPALVDELGIAATIVIGGAGIDTAAADLFSTPASTPERHAVFINDGDVDSELDLHFRAELPAGDATFPFAVVAIDFGGNISPPSPSLQVELEPPAEASAPGCSCTGRDAARWPYLLGSVPAWFILCRGFGGAIACSRKKTPRGVPVLHSPPDRPSPPVRYPSPSPLAPSPFAPRRATPFQAAFQTSDRPLD